MLKADLNRLIALASDAESVRVAAARQLASLPRYHFDDHAVETYRLPDGWADAMAAAWQATNSGAVRAWIAQGVALADPWPRKAIEPLALSFLDIEGPYFARVVRFALSVASCTPTAKARVLALRSHRDPKVRAELAILLPRWVDHASDAPIVHQLMLDPDSFVRGCAVQSAGRLEGFGPADVEVLLDVVNMDNRNARAWALELIESIRERLPDCAPDACAPRVPLLRTDGLYYTHATEFDIAGRWMTNRCLRFFPDGTVHAFGTDEAPVDFWLTMAHRAHTVQPGTVHKDDAALSFTIATAAGPVDHAGRIDGCAIRLTRLDHSTGQSVEDVYDYAFVDWDEPAAPEAAPPAKPPGKALVAVPFERLRPASMIIIEAAQWYWQMAARIPIFLDGLDSDERRFKRAWFLKDEMRKSAAKALFISSLRRQLFETFPLPDADELLRAAGSGSANPYTAALQALEASTADERQMYRGPYPEAIGTVYIGAKGRFALTEQGWRRQ